MDSIFKIAIAVGGAVASFLWGEWSALLNVLLVFVAIDYTSGFIAAGIDGRLNSHIGWVGIAKKVSIFFIVAVAHMVDVAMGGDAHMFRDAAVWFYLANELLSITENAGRIGVPIPAKLTDAVDVLRGKSDDK
ncbi:phage holin family protein [Oceanobacillus caeni]|uniref:phage holin family protein n=1 Tax=Oceanobacillus caeni TaxID=405946 RepID=UPI002149FE72|nr:phage holin family protein [Oceanobacillus caeni]MCR1834962.1 phage holin family protein [Oceanobacillus caeni]